MEERLYSKALANSAKRVRLYLIGFIVLTVVGLGIFGYTLYSKEIGVPKIERVSDILKYKEGSNVKIVSDVFAYNGFVENDKYGKEISWFYVVRPSSEFDFVMVKGKKKYINENPHKVHTFLGSIQKNSYYKDDLVNFAQLIEMEVEDARPYLSTLLIDEKFSKDYYYTVIIPLLGILGVAVMCFSPGGKIRKNKELLASFCDIEEADSAFSLEAEKGDVEKIGKLTLSKNWVFNDSWNDVFLFPAKEVAWVYKTITTNKQNGVPVGQTFSVNFALSNGKMVTAVSSPVGIDDCLDYVMANWPALVGYSEERRAAWTTGYEDFVAEWKAAVLKRQSNEDNR